MTAVIQPYRFAPAGGGPGGATYVDGKTGNEPTDTTWVWDLSDLAMQEDDLLLLAINRPSSINIDVTALSGWTEVCDLHMDAAYDTNFAVFYKFMGAVPDTDVTIDNAAGYVVAAVQVFRGIDPASPLDVAVQTAQNFGSGVPNPPSITPITSGAKIVAIGAATWQLGTGGAAFTSGLDNFISEKFDDNVYSMVVGMGTHDWDGSGAYDPAAFGGGNSANTWCAATIALRPA